MNQALKKVPPFVKLALHHVLMQRNDWCNVGKCEEKKEVKGLNSYFSTCNFFYLYSGKLNLVSQTCEVKLEERFVELNRPYSFLLSLKEQLWYCRSRFFFCCFKALSKTLNPPKGLTFRAPLSIVAEFQPENSA